MLKMSEIKSWDENAITSKVAELRKEIFEAKMQKVTAGVEKPHRFKELKKDIARLLTVKNAGR